MSKPTNLPIWDSTQVNSVVPDSTRQLEGWLSPGGVPEKPILEYENYFKNHVYRWIEYYDSLNIDYRFDSVADMVAYTDFTVGETVETSAYYSTQNGGSALYNIVSSGTGTHNGGSYIDLTGSGLQAELIQIGHTNVSQWGTKADGITDDSTAINAAILYTYNNKTQIVIMPGTDSITGGYGVASPILICKNIVLYAEHAKAVSLGTNSVLTTGQIIGGALVTNIGETSITATNEVNYSRIEGLYCDGNGLSTDPVIDMNLFLVNTALDNVRLSRGTVAAPYGLRLRNSWNTKIDNFYSNFGLSTGACIYMDYDGLPGASKISITNSKILGAAGIGIHSAGMSSININNGDISECGTGIKITGASVGSYSITGNHCEGNIVDIELGTIGGGVVFDGVIENNNCLGNASVASTFLKMNRAQGWRIGMNPWVAGAAGGTKYDISNETSNQSNFITEEQNYEYDWSVDGLGLKGGFNFITFTDGVQSDFTSLTKYKTDGSSTPKIISTGYDQGTWTPVLARSTGGAITATYTTQEGFYIRTGNQVTLIFNISTSSISAQGTGNLLITGIPYATTTDLQNLACGGITRSSATPSSNEVFTIDSTSLIIQNASRTDVETGNWGTGALRGSITYIIKDQ